MDSDNAFYGARERGTDGEPCKFAIGDKVRLKDGTGPAMTVTLTMRHPDERHLYEVNCEYEHHDAKWSRRFAVDDLELVERADP